MRSAGTPRPGLTRSPFAPRCVPRWQGQYIVLGTTGVPGSTCTGNTFLTLTVQTGAPVASNGMASGDMGCSMITYVAPKAGASGAR